MRVRGRRISGVGETCGNNTGLVGLLAAKVVQMGLTAKGPGVCVES